MTRGENGSKRLWTIILSDDEDSFSSRFLEAHGKRLEHNPSYISNDELLGLGISQSRILQCHQSLGDIVVIPSRAWYQVNRVNE